MQSDISLPVFYQSRMKIFTKILIAAVIAGAAYAVRKSVRKLLGQDVDGKYSEYSEYGDIDSGKWRRRK